MDERMYEEGLEDLAGEIDRLRADLVDTEALYEEFVDKYDLAADRAAKAESRLAAVIAICDRTFKYHDFEGKNDLRAIRAAATGDTK